MSFHPSKQLGQNFLINEGIVDKIIVASELTKSDTVLEVGPGRGVLTEEIVKRAGRVIAVEKDKKLYELLKEKFKDAKNLELINEDIFKFNIKEGLRQAQAIFPERTSSPISPERSGESRGYLKNYKLIANIPYNITGQFFHNFLLSEHRPRMIVVMVQKEVGERLIGKNRSILSLTAELYGTAEKVCDVAPGSFSPAPKVTSMVVKLTIGLAMSNSLEREILHLARIGFASRRKKLLSNLSTGLKISKDKIREIFNQIGLNENARAEELSLSDWLKLAEKI